MNTLANLTKRLTTKNELDLSLELMSCKRFCKKVALQLSITTSIFVHIIISVRLLNADIIRFVQVALNLLSEREKDELVQLVDTMVSYSITYRNTKLEPQERISGSMVSPDVPSLSLDPAINDIINFKVLFETSVLFYPTVCSSHCK